MDLRNNPGGLLSQAINIADVLVNADVVIDDIEVDAGIEIADLSIDDVIEETVVEAEELPIVFTPNEGTIIVSPSVNVPSIFASSNSVTDCVPS